MTNAPKDAGAPRARMPWWKLALFAPLPLLALMLLLEGALWAAGLGDPDERLSMTRGFSERARYLLPDPDHPGGWVTQITDGSYPEQTIPPKSERLRVIMFGGSNTQGFPRAYIEKRLNLAAPSPGYEVINLGRAGYGSERVLILLRQAMVLEPDVVFIYSGHNEFVERGFAMELVQMWKAPWMSRVAERLSRLRTLNVVAELLEGDLSGAAAQPIAAASGPGGGAADGSTAGDGAADGGAAGEQAASGGAAAPTRRPEERQPRGEEFRHLRYDETLVVYEVYRRNLQSMLRTVREQGAELLVSTVVGNMLFPPIVPGMPEELTPDRAADMRRRLARAYGSIPERLRAGLIQTGAEPVAHLDPRDWGEALDPAGQAKRRAIGLAAGYHPNPPALRALSPPFDGGPFWTDPTLWSVEPMRILPTIAALHERRIGPGERLELEKAVRALEELRAELPHHPLVLHALGVCRYALGEDEAAVQHLREAARYDRAPTRGNDVTNGIVRELAAANPWATFVDAESLVRAACPSGLVSYELMMDNCHLHQHALPRLMDLFVPGLLELGARRARAAR